MIKKDRIFRILAIVGIFFYLYYLCPLLFSLSARAKDRCQDFIPDVRSNMIRYNGLDYPWWYSMGCMIQESNCRPDIISFDGGIGLFQLTPSTGIVADIQKDIPVDPYNPASNIRAHAFYINKVKNTYLKRGKFKFKSKYEISPIAFTTKCGSNLSDVYRYYNGGYWFIHESKLADSTYACEQKDMKDHCVRGGVWVGSGDKKRWLSFCEVNYNYADQVYKYSQKYKTGKDSINFYYVKPKPIEKPITVEKPKPIEKPIVIEKPIENQKPITRTLFERIVLFFKSLFKIA
jgi:hypothetical protein